VYPTSADSPAFWLYTSGTTGAPKAAIHRHGAIEVVCETYGAEVLGIHRDDRCLSAAKAFFAYGLGNSVAAAARGNTGRRRLLHLPGPDQRYAQGLRHLGVAGRGGSRLLAHEAVAQVVVVAAPDENGLEKPVAFVICEPRRTVTEAELIEFCRQTLPSFKRPRKVVFVTAYPTTATGKVRRVELRRMAARVFVPSDPPTEAVPS
jgi:acyl-coenzyme A synthetase/AMP-(fatty) acid ligase